MRYASLIVLLIVCFASGVRSQERTGYGGYGNFSDNIHSANFQQLPGVPSCCPRYESGSGSGIALGVLYQVPILSSLDLQMRLGYQSLGGELSITESTTVYNNGAPATGAFQHTLNASISEIGIQPMIGISLLQHLRLFAGARVGFIIAKSYSQQEEIIQPESAGTFADSLGNDTHSRIRNQFSGSIPNVTPIQIAAVAVLSYQLPLNSSGTLSAVPEIAYSYSMTDIASDLIWRVNSINIGVAIIFNSTEILTEREH